MKLNKSLSIMLVMSSLCVYLPSLAQASATKAATTSERWYDCTSDEATHFHAGELAHSPQEAVEKFRFDYLIPRSVNAVCI